MKISIEIKSQDTKKEVRYRFNISNYKQIQST